MRDTWYILEDGTRVSPADVTPDEKGVLVHKSGAAVAIGPHGYPRSAGVDLDSEGNLVKPKDMLPEQGRQTYKTRESKSR